MELRDYWRLVIRNLPTMLASLVVGILVSTVVTFSMTPIYQASAQIFVSTPASSLDISALATGSSFSQQRVKSYSQIINGPDTLAPVIKELGLKETPFELAKRVTASAPLDTVLITLKVSDKDPEMAAKIANLVAKHFSSTVAKLEISQASTGQSPVKVSTVKKAEVPGSPSSPKKALNLLLGILLGLGMGVAISIVRQIFDNTIKVDTQIAPMPMLAAIPFDKDAATKPLITQIGRYAVRTEAFRQLRTNLQFIRPDDSPRVIAIASSLPGEGKTTTSVNLALTLKQAGARVVLVEGDLRRPKLRDYLGINKETIGLSEILSNYSKFSDPKEIKKVIKVVAEENLEVIASGAIPPNPAELLNSNAMTQLIAYLKSEYDYVVIDCPPLLPITDGALIAAKSDGVLLVIRAGVTKLNEFKSSIEAVEAVGSNILGAEINMIPQDRSYYDYGYRYGYGSKYGYSRSKYGYKATTENTSYAPQKD